MRAKSNGWATEMLSITAARTLSGTIATASLIVAFMLSNDEPSGMPLILIDQGVSAQRISSRDVFVSREGSFLRIWDRTTPGTESPLVFCPRESFFVSPEDKALFDDQGRYVAGPGNGDMVQHVTKIDPGAIVKLGKRVFPKRSEGTITGEAAKAYQDWLADPSKAQRFCQDEVPNIS